MVGSSELTHHGIKGQKWGIRRYRNLDGTLTDEGKEHIRKVDSRAKAAGIIGGIVGGIAGAALTPTTVQRGAEFTEAIIDKPILKNRKHILYNKGSETGMQILGAIGGAVLGYKIASNAALRVQKTTPKEHKKRLYEMEFGVESDSEQITHHGIKGQHWGVRRYQNEDNSLTPAGKERYGIGESSGKGKIGTFVSKHKKGLAIAGGLLVAGVAAYGISRLANNKSVQKGAEATKEILEEHKITLEVPKTTVPRIVTPKVDTKAVQKNAERFRKNANDVMKKNKRAIQEFDRLNDEVLKKLLKN